MRLVRDPAFYNKFDTKVTEGGKLMLPSLGDYSRLVADTKGLERISFEDAQALLNTDPRTVAYGDGMFHDSIIRAVRKQLDKAPIDICMHRDHFPIAQLDSGHLLTLRSTARSLCEAGKMEQGLEYAHLTHLT